MLTKLTVRGFKRFDFAEIELGNPAVLIGPNDSGKTSALQALALWGIGLRRMRKKNGKDAGERRRGVAINRRDLFALPVPDARMLWHELQTRNSSGGTGGASERARIEITVEGVGPTDAWCCGLEFDYANRESFYCRPLRRGNSGGRMAIPSAAQDLELTYLPPLSGLSHQEFQKQPGEIRYLVARGRSGEALRNLCRVLATTPPPDDRWQRVVDRIENLFGMRLEDPICDEDTSRIELNLLRSDGLRFDIGSAGRGLQQTLMLLAILSSHPGSVLLLDEPDAHLETLRQGEIYRLLVQTAQEFGSQVIAATHSEAILNQAAERDVVVSFLGKPHRVDRQGAGLMKELSSVGYDRFGQADQTGWVLYLHGTSDLPVLRTFAKSLGHPAADVLRRPYVHCVESRITEARQHFRSLCRARKDLLGFVLCGRIDKPLLQTDELREYMWKRRQIENYLCRPEALRAYARSLGKGTTAGPLFENLFEQERREQMVLMMDRCLEKHTPPRALEEPDDAFWINGKLGEEFLPALFEDFFAGLGWPNLMARNGHHRLASSVPAEMIDPEVEIVLDAVLDVARHARPATVPHVSHPRSALSRSKS